MERPPARATPADPTDWWWIFDPRLSLRARAAWFAGGGAVLFTLVFSHLAGTLHHRALERQLGDALETLAFQVSDKLDRTIAQRQQDLQLAAALAPFRSSDGSNPDRRQVLEALQDGGREFAWIGFADPAGRVRAATRGVLENTSVEPRGWFRNGRERMHAAGPAAFPALARELAGTRGDAAANFIELALPVSAADGPFLGVLAAALNWEWMREIQLSVVPESARREQLGVTVYSTAGEVLLDSGASGWTQPPEPPALGEARRFRGSLLEATSGGTTYLTGFARSRGQREFRGLGWLIAVRQPAALAFAPARDLERRIAGWGMLFSAGLTLLAWHVAGRFVRRLRGIRTAAERIREGDLLTVMPQPRSAAEFDRMCGALGEMVEEFRARPAPPPPAASPPAGRQEPR
jgi:HAMP domain-containing protein